jgi:subtilase family serine protease
LAANSPTVVLAGADPGLVAKDQDESTLDVEWSGAVAPAATVKLVVGASTATTDGVDLAAAYIVNHASAPVVSLSYGSCEQEMGAAGLAFYNGLWEQAASQGMSVFVASGDAGAAGCSSATDVMGSGAAVNGLCSSPYSTCVGGTEFNEGSNSAQYWSTASSANYGSALGYIPEKVWNESAFTGGSGLWATGGGASGVYAQAAWQADLSGTSASSGMRAVPDVAVSAADHDGYFVVENGSYLIVSGTSAASPSFAGLMALVIDGQHGAAQGNANARLYSFTKFARSPFHATPSGNNSVPGAEGFTANGADYNLATGLGSVDGTLLVNGWAAASEILPKGCSGNGLFPKRCLPVRRMPIWGSKGSEF